MESCDVAIIGAGPAGSAAAIGLAQRGYEVALIDKRSFPREKLCGDFVNPINWPLFRELGVEERILTEPHAKVSGFRITSPAGHEAAASFGALDQQQAFGLGIRRVYLDQVLVHRAAELGVTVRVERRMENLSRTARGWRLKASGEEEWQAKLLVGADGRNSWVAERLGLNQHGALAGRSVGFQSRLSGRALVGDQVEIHLFPGGYAGLVGLGDGTINLCLAVDKRRLRRQGITECLFSEILPRNPHLKCILARTEVVSELRSVYPVYFPSRCCFGDQVLLAGDAARVSEPVTGEGIYLAMRSGLLAAETIDLALRRKNLATAGLAGYERACRRAFRPRLALNALLRFAMYRPALVDPLIRLSAKNDRLLNSLVDAVCMP